MTVSSTPPILELRDLRKHFGGLEVLRGLETTIANGEVRAIIGPNGAGKTTFINVVTGVYRASAGKVILNQEDVTQLAAYKIARRGMVRTYQIASLFLDLTVVENVQVACYAARRFAHVRRGRPSSSYIEQAHCSLALVHLTHVANRKAGELSHGDQRLLEVAIATSLSPKLLLLDEPTAGMSPTETHRFIELVNRTLRGLYTIVLVEHDMKVVMNTADVISVLAMGSVLAEGTPSEIRTNPRVQEAYLGSAYA